jgi:probable rRNA maturation factor
VKLKLSVQQASTIDATLRPTRQQLQQWAEAALIEAASTELTIRLVDEAESSALNQQYRHKSGPTNVLSFPFEAPMPGMDIPLLGDVVICAPRVVCEASEQGKPLLAHWAHLVIHGVLHLQGYDHQTDAEAELMEALEVSLLTRLGYANPYQDDDI